MDNTLTTFLITITILTMVPGADTMIMFRNTLRGGIKDGLTSNFGISLGLMFHAVLSAIGISAILLYSVTAFALLKTLGAIYLLWLGFSNIKIYLQSRNNQEKLNVKTSEFIFARSIKEGFLSNALNPKIVIFYMAFLPQFIDNSSSVLFQSIYLAFFHFCISFIWLGFLSYTIISANGFITRPKVRERLELFSGVVMIVLGIKLLLEKRE
ncbi:LysE family translocator [Poseidonibacter antarcticus]|uniref:LysE family translocator n=1 Tax=Poseidonibacter antarcticus TaxID=2478538 RepID=UPI000EF45119|nr:LysE family translocator [Poseidonibacter antarcticus]